MNNDSGQLSVPLPPDRPATFAQLLVFYGLVPIVAPVLAAYKFVTAVSFRSTIPGLYSLVSSATAAPISTLRHYQDASLLKRLWESPSARAYVDEETKEPLLEYQLREGYCGSATMRCMLRSLGFSGDVLPPQARGETAPERWREEALRIVEEYPGDIEVSVRIARDADYQTFLKTLREGLANEDVRVGCNYLRSALFGFERSRLVPANLILAMFGHFSPIVGMIESADFPGRETLGDGEGKSESDDPLVAIFDTNHKYGGVYLVPARRLYGAVRTKDLRSNQYRALVLLEKKK